MQNRSSVSIEEFVTLIEKSFTNNGERYLNAAIENLRKGKLENIEYISASLQYIPEDWIEKNIDKLINTFKALPETTVDPFIALLGRMIPSPHLRSEGQNIIKTIIVPRVVKSCSHETLMKIAAAIDLELINGSAISRIADVSWKSSVEDGVLINSKIKGDLWSKIEEHQFSNENEKHQALLCCFKYGNVEFDKVLNYIKKIGGVRENGVNGLDLNERIQYYEKINQTHQLLQQLILSFKLGLAPISNQLLHILLQHCALINQLPPVTISLLFTTIIVLMDNIKGILMTRISLLLPLLLEFIKQNKLNERYHSIIIQAKSIVQTLSLESKPFLNKQDSEIMAELQQLLI
ncbi:hypothetical protein ENUP19_0254G0008 [Entamoeba nuttalli]|uniref:Uncharacterized protein n=2 Tax=Entamoeba nuttalli TaxID=412467 RepID=K2H7C8_ENTNP|nr:hypothetical protein ENU1_166630 [Entamoeba nuttalli P19]EKE38429.1 hypothetical protein ENU1_166630 [Entamoeba nuttalli P19]|eukprot:XP_008859236.1 hypothetical protein ENU1_166630 [Entamoeba nuttalli P19]